MALGEVLLWLLFFALLVPAGVTGWAIGHYTAHTRTVTAPAAQAAPTTTSAPATTAPATTAQTTTAQATTAPATTAAVAAGGNPAKGKTVFTSSGCGACHTLKAAGSTATVGPDLDTKLTADAAKANMPLAAFVRESIVKPDAYLSPGYPKGVMPSTFGQQLTPAQLADLVSFVLGGR